LAYPVFCLKLGFASMDGASTALRTSNPTRTAQFSFFDEPSTGVRRVRLPRDMLMM
jgi:hypothetical protein